MKRKIKMFIVCAISILALASCKMPTKLLTETVKHLISEECSKDGIKVVRLSELTHEDGDNYTGIVTLEADGEKENFNVEVVYDGDSIDWEIKTDDL